MKRAIDVAPFGEFSDPRVLAELPLHHGLTLLAGGEPVTVVALACGSSNPSAFTAAFRDAFGVTPARYARETRP
ncbi:helix-turn-helix domain-containing protein [Parafrankia sp. EUN1f]|uniref:helix-turn-helix domain-containing protein n=1 Tax=Parafrankia sp. EUN1f TaxID=102897 RepID=UPI0001C46785|nr:AraC family transcriptional regulator [Parafrankia sp. EUN1f]EFC81270.1 transcriptional regulator, AraC family [Parafrankia sp. EUN1f]